jgi:hypothetical protein
VEIHERAEEVVAPADHSPAPAFRTAHSGEQYSGRAVHLHDLLKGYHPPEGWIIMGQPLSRDKTLETLGVLALASIAAGLYFKLEFLQYFAGVLLLIGIFLKRPAVLIASAWLKFGHLLGTINTRILLALAFYLVLTPLAVIYRMFHRDFLQIGPGRRSASLWHERNHTYTARDFENLW